MSKDEILENEMMNKHSTFELGEHSKFLVKPHIVNKIIKVLKICKEYSFDYFILGNGCNLLISDNWYNGLVINIHEENFSDLKVKQIDEINYEVKVEGGIYMRTLAKKLCLLSFSGWEDIIDIPVSIGRRIIVNAAADIKNKFIFNSLNEVKVISPEVQIKEFSKKKCKFVHRGSMLKDKKYIIIEATFNLIKEDKMIIQKRMADHTSGR